MTHCRMSPILHVLISFAIFGFTSAKVEFAYSTLYGIYDFQGVDEVYLPQCDAGCLIYASTAGAYKSDDGFDPYMKNLVVYDSVKGYNRSIAELGTDFQVGTSQKIPLDISPGLNISILNFNDPKDQVDDVTVWVIDRAFARGFEYEIYDAVAMDRMPSVPAQIVTIMSAYRFMLQAEPAEDTAFTARMAGFDNALDTNLDGCKAAYQTVKGSTFDGFDFGVTSPLISLTFEKKVRLNITAGYNYYPKRKMTGPTFVASPGYLGCSALKGEVTYRSFSYYYTQTIELYSKDELFDVSVEADYSFTDNHYVTLKDETNDDSAIPFFQTGHTKFVLENTQDLVIDYKDITPPQNFIFRFTPTVRGATVATTTQTPSVVSANDWTSPKTSPATSQQPTSTTHAPTTSVAENGFLALLASAVTLMYALL